MRFIITKLSQTLDCMDIIYLRYLQNYELMIEITSYDYQRALRFRFHQFFPNDQNSSFRFCNIPDPPDFLTPFFSNFQL
jgi:hypothetical protein